MTLLILFLSGSLWAANLSLTFDDAPRPNTSLSGLERTRKIINALQNNGAAEAVFYCRPRKKMNEVEILRLQLYGKAGHLIANHTSRHKKLSEVSAEDFIEDIKNTHAQLKPFYGFRSWFRFPYLDEAEKDALKNSLVKKFLAEQNYRLGFATIEIYDWHIDQRMHEALAQGKKVDHQKLKNLYIKVFQESIQAYDEFAFKILGYSPNHAILLHENDLNALMLDSVLKELSSRHKFIKGHEVFNDPIADSKWDKSLISMRRLSAIRQEEKIQIDFHSPWTDIKALDKLIMEMNVFE